MDPPAGAKCVMYLHRTLDQMIQVATYDTRASLEAMFDGMEREVYELGLLKAPPVPPSRTGLDPPPVRGRGVPGEAPAAAGGGGYFHRYWAPPRPGEPPATACPLLLPRGACVSLMAAAAPYDATTCCHYLDGVARGGVVGLWRRAALVLAGHARGPWAWGYPPRHGEPALLCGAFVQRTAAGGFAVALVTRGARAGAAVSVLLQDASRRLGRGFTRVFQPFPIGAPLRRVALRLWWETSPRRVVPGARLPALRVILDDRRGDFGPARAATQSNAGGLAAIHAFKGYRAVRLFLARPMSSRLLGQCLQAVPHRLVEQRHLMRPYISIEELAHFYTPGDDTPQTAGSIEPSGERDQPIKIAHSTPSHSDSTIRDLPTSERADADFSPVSHRHEGVSAPDSTLPQSNSVGVCDESQMLRKSLSSSSEGSRHRSVSVRSIGETVPPLALQSNSPPLNEDESNKQSFSTIGAESTTYSCNDATPHISYPNLKFLVDRYTEKPEIYARTDFLFEDLRVDAIGEHLIGIEVDVESSYRPFIPMLYGYVGPFLVVNEPYG